jgi:dTDP-4-amino-4,6-dideoxygalactose transaminase
MTSKQPACTPFNRPAITGFEQAYLAQAIESGQLAAGGPFSKRCKSWLRDHFATARSLTTNSCTHALEMAALQPAQLECGRVITDDRLRSWHAYLQALSLLAEHGLVELPVIPDACRHNGHIFWIKTRDQEQQSSLIAFLKQRSIHCAFHYSPLHSSPAGRRHGRFAGEDRYTSQESSRLVRGSLCTMVSGRQNVLLKPSMPSTVSRRARAKLWL